ncbi:MAG: hypothetical protein SF051_14125 [Elusimicrobiota bacterium]|nr:hypothetical protein [Elusimicrobiota bacterium]
MARNPRLKSPPEVVAAPAASTSIPAAALVVGIAIWLLVLLRHIDSASGMPWLKYAGQWLASSWALVPAPGLILAHAGRLAALAAFMLLLFGNGSLLLKAAGLRTHGVWEEFAVGFGLGYGLFASLLLLLGLAGLWHNAAFAVLALAGGAAALFRLVQLLREWPERFGRIEGRPEPLALFCFWSFTLLWFYHLRYALVPETFYDALQYHLALPNLYLLHSRIIPTPENSYSGIPSLPQMINGWSLAWDRWGIMASLLHHAMAPLVAATLMAFARRMKRPEAGPLAAAAFFLIPVVMGESFRVSVGMEWTLFQLLSFLALYAGVAAPPGTRERIAWMSLCGVFLGLAMSCKYPAWLAAAALLPPLYLLRPRSDRPEAPVFTPRDLGLVALCAALVLLPWVLKNLLFYGNPIFPFYHETFAPDSTFMPGWREISAAGSNWKDTLLTASGLKRYLLHPWTFATPPDDITESIGPLVLALLPLPLLSRLSNEERLLGWLFLACWVPLSLLSGLTRFFIPHLALLVLLEASVLAALQPRWARQALTGFACAALALTALAWVAADSHREKLKVFAGERAFGDYLAHTAVSYPTPPFAGIEYLNRETPAKAKVLVHGDGRAFYLRRDYVAPTADQRPLLETLAAASTGVEDLRDLVRREGFSYVLVNLGEMSRRQLRPRLPPEKLRILDEFWKRYTTRVFGALDPRDRWVGVYELLDEQRASQPHSTDDLFGAHLKAAAAAR